MIDTSRSDKSTVSPEAGFSALLTKGYQPQAIDPYITGYFYVLWTRLPDFLTNQGNVLGANFSHLCRVVNNGFTLPDITLNTTDVPLGFGGTNKLSVPTNIDMSNEISIKYLELSGLPVSRFHTSWISGIRDYASGVSQIKNYSQYNITGDCLYITTKPVMNNDNNKQIIESAHLFTGVFPNTDKQSSFAGDLTSSDKVDLEVPYKFHQMFHGKNTLAYAEGKLAQMIKLADMSAFNIADGGPKRA